MTQDEFMDKIVRLLANQAYFRYWRDYIDHPGDHYVFGYINSFEEPSTASGLPELGCTHLESSKWGQYEYLHLWKTPSISDKYAS